MTIETAEHARIVIIGGGVIGTSIAYHLALAGEVDVMLLEKAQLTHGCTWHAAGLVGQLRSRRNLTRLMQNSVAVFDRLESESGLSIDWKKVGSLRLASSKQRWREIQRSMSQAKSFGVDCEALSADEAQQRFPYITTDGVAGAVFIPGDGYIDPYALTQAYAAVARSKGVRIVQDTLVNEIIVKDRKVVAVNSDKGKIICDIVVNCAGLWAKRVGEMAGVSLATGIVEHQYFITEKKLSFDSDLTTLRDPDNNFYLKPDTGAFAIGGWEENSKGCWRGKPPFDFGRELFAENMPRLERFALPASRRLPILNEIGIRSVINGPIPVSADGEPIMGRVPELDNFYVACGFTAGIAASGGAGLAMSNWILEGDPGMDLWAFDVRRFGPQQAQGRYLQARAIETYAGYYKIHWPGHEASSARGLRRSPLYPALKQAGAVFGSKFGWERVNYFKHPGIDAGHLPSFDRKPGWFEQIAYECRAIQNTVAMIDQSSFAKFEVSGPGAFEALDNLIANRMPEHKGGAVYTQMCNARGGIEADVTVIRVCGDEFMVVTGAGFATRDYDWIERHIRAVSDVSLRDISASLSVINLCGPNARDVLQSLSDDDLSDRNMPLLSATTIELGNTDVLAVRIGYVGELGFELYVRPENALHVHESLWHAGREFDIVNAGYYAIESCRLEKGYVYWSSDIGPDINPYQAGLGFCVALDKKAFTGQRALQQLSRQQGDKALTTLYHPEFLPLYGGEPVFSDGELIGYTTSAGYGHRLGCNIAYAYLPRAVIDRTDVEVEAFGTLYRINIGTRCLYDPGNRRLKA